MSSIPPNRQRLLNLFSKLLPLVNDLTNKLSIVLVVALICLGWLFYYLYHLHSTSLPTSVIVVGICGLPLLVLFKFWWALSGIRDLPNIARQIMGDARGNATQTLNEVKTGKRSLVDLAAQIKAMLQVKELLLSGKDMLSQYLSVGILVNPASLFMGALSLIAVALLVVVSVILGMVSLF